MSFSLWVALLGLPLTVECQSGDVDVDIDTGIICTSHISLKMGNSLTCNLAGGMHNEDEEYEEEEDKIHNISACVISFISDNTTKCVTAHGNNITASLQPLHTYNVTVHTKSCRSFNRILDLREIVKPRSPHMWNATFDPQSDMARIYIQMPYRNDYIRLENLLFEFDIWSTGNRMNKTTTGSESVVIVGNSLKKNTEYHAKVRAIPYNTFKGTWSEWSDSIPFFTQSDLEATREGKHLLWSLAVLLALLTLLIWIIRGKKVFHKIQTYMGPYVWHPKPILVHIYKPIKGLSFEPELFRDWNIDPVKKIEGQTFPTVDSRPTDQIMSLKDLCLNQVLVLSVGSPESSSSDTSACTGESASTLLSLSSAGEEYPHPRSRSPSPIDDMCPDQGLDPDPAVDSCEEPDPETCGETKQARGEVYVTMSSFYHVKENGDEQV